MREIERSDQLDVAARHYEATVHPFTSLYAEAALARVDLKPGDRVLDVAAGTGALTLPAALAGAQVLATDISPGMIARICAAGLPNVETRVMDGQALDLSDHSFDAVFSIFGVVRFENWRKGLAEMARVTRIGGYGVVTAWRDHGAPPILLLDQIRRKLFPDRVGAAIPEAMDVLSRPATLQHELRAAGYSEVQIEPVVRDYELRTAALDDPDKLFGASPDWATLSAPEKASIVVEVRRMAGSQAILPVAATALVAVARR